MRLTNKEVLKENKLKGKFYLLSSRMVNCTFCYASLRNDRHAIDQNSMRVRTTVIHDCMQLKVKIIVFHAQSID